MAGISNLGSILSQRYMLASLREQVNDTQRQINTGKLSTSIADMGTLGASNSISFRNKNNLLDRYTENINLANTRLTVIDAAMGQVATSARDALATLRSQLQDTDPKATIIADEARTLLNSVIAKLNEQVNGQYIFAGDDLYNAPVDNPAALNANAAAGVAVWLTGTTAATVVADARAANGLTLGYSSTLLTSGNVSFIADDNVEVDYTTPAYQNGFADVLRGLSVIANLPQPTTALEQASYWDIVNGAITLLDEGAIAIDTAQGLLGNKTRQVDGLLAEHKETKATYEQFIGSVEDVDMAEASTMFQTIQSQMQMSYSVISILKDLSLVNYL